MSEEDKTIWEEFGAPRPPRTIPDEDPILAPTIEKPGREKFRRDTIEKALADGKRADDDEQPVLVMMGGGMASGKSTVIRYLQEQGFIPIQAVVINSDLFKLEIPEYQEVLRQGDPRAVDVVVDESTLMAREAVEEGIRRRFSMVFDSTMSDPTFAQAIMTRAKSAGYNVKLVGTTVSLETAFRHAAERASRTGRHPNTKRFLRSHKTFSTNWERFARLADEAVLYDNEHAPQLIGEKQGAEFKVVNQGLYDRFKRKENINENATQRAQIGG